MPPRRQELLSKAQLEELYFDQGMSLTQIAEVTGTNYRLVRDSFKKHGLSWRSKSEARIGRAWDEATKAKIAASRRGFKDAPETAARKRAILASVSDWMKYAPPEDPRRLRHREAVAAAMKRPEVRDALSRLRVSQIQAGGYYDRGYHDSPKAGRVYYMSGWELQRWQELDQDPEVTQYMRSPCCIPYQWEGSLHRYVPDVLITYRNGSKILEEIKPLPLLRNPSKWQGKLLAKVRAGEDFAKVQGWGWRIFSY